MRKFPLVFQESHAQYKSIEHLPSISCIYSGSLPRTKLILNYVNKVCMSNPSTHLDVKMNKVCFMKSSYQERFGYRIYPPGSVTNQDQVREPEDQQENNVEMPSTSQEEIPSSAGPSTSGLQKKRLSDTSDDSSRAEDSSFSLYDESSYNGHNSEEEAGRDVTSDPNMSFTDMLQTTDETVTTAKMHRKPAINSRAQVITKDLFREHENKTNAPGKIRKRAGKSKATGKKN
ncbi:hypothetical protein MML48_5g00012013 [Holotrichia oblita]|uniref:Uncharacterized protein n=1 Tax=Holotrichia oblita TaxID=644536 RepID=A0ACB9T3C5_HOLOL|nr:hypothetical protein MML48_5g00012013 [Holotrichia oblita]